MNQVDIRHIPTKHLKASPKNVRRTAKRNAIDELKASILAHGLMQNLVVTEGKGGVFHVIAGGRRLDALTTLQSEGHLPDDYSVPCQVVSAEHSHELSLAENVARVAMHPADEFEAYVKLVENGQTAGEVAQRFGVTEKHVLQRLKLGRVAPKLIAEYREGNIDLECLMAFTVTDDPKRQMEVYQSLREWHRNPEDIRSRLTEKAVKGTSKRARFVGTDAYVQAGGVVRTDLFGDEVYLESPDLLAQLADEKLGEIRLQLEAEGWGWVEVGPDYDYTLVGKCGRLKTVPVDPPPELLAEKEAAQVEFDAAEARFNECEVDDEIDGAAEARFGAAQERLENIEHRLSQCVRFDPEQMKSAGCHVSIGQDGQARIERGLVRKKDQKKAEAASAKGEAAERKEQNEGLSQTLKHDLAAYRLQVAQVAIAKNPTLAFDLLTFRAASDALAHHSAFDGPNVQFVANYAKPSEPGDTKAGNEFEDVFSKLPRDWMKPKRESERFTAFQALTLEEKWSIFAYCVANTLRPCLAPTDAKEASAYDLALSQTGVSVSDYWRPTKENYLGRLTRDQLLGLGEEIFRNGWASRRGAMKKGALVEELHNAFGYPDDNKAEAEKLETWLPCGMAFDLGAAPKKSSKKKKA